MIEDKAMYKDALFFNFANQKYNGELHYHFYNTPTTPLHSHDYFELFVITQGSASHSFKGEKQTITAGTVCLIAPYEQHQFLKSKHAHEHFNLAMESASFKQICDTLSPKVYSALTNGPRYYKMSDLEFQYFNSLLELVLTSSEHQSKILVKSISASIIAQLVRFENDEDTLPDWLKDFCEKIKLSEYFLKSVEELSKLVPYSRSILNTEFKNYMNDTLISYITKLRVNYAANLLAFSDCSIVEICNMINYSSLSHFNRTFKNIMGYTPAEYRHMFSKH